jgi:hypothetical protein
VIPHHFAEPPHAASGVSASVGLPLYLAIKIAYIQPSLFDIGVISADPQRTGHLDSTRARKRFVRRQHAKPRLRTAFSPADRNMLWRGE